MSEDAIIEIRVPDIGDFEDVPVIELLVAEGDIVEAEQALLVLESDKSTMEVPAPVAGRVVSLRLKVGDRVREGDPICALETVTTATAPAADTPPAPAPDDVRETPDAPPAAEAQATEAATPDASAPASAEPVEVSIPDIGDFEAVPVIELLVADGDVVEAEQALLVLESDKSTMEVPAPAAGRIDGLRLKVGDKVSQGDAVCRILSAAGQAPKAPAAAAPDAAAAKPASPAPSTESPAPRPARSEQGPRMQPAAAPGLLPHASPGVRRFARELGVDLALVQGSGPKQRILLEDVQRYVKGALSAAPAPAADTSASGIGSGALPSPPSIDFSKFGEIEQKPLSRIRKLSAQNLHRNWLLVPHVTQTDEVDITELEAFRREASTAAVKLTLLPFLIKAVGAALQAYPEFNSSLAPDGESLILKRYCHIGFAADTEQGLVVPVVRDVWAKSVTEIARDCADLAAKARDGKLKADDMRGGCFSISSLGGIGGSHFTPIVNLPEVAILGVSRAQMKPVWNGEKFKPRLMCPLSLSYDHRVIDGAAAARFIVHLGGLLSDVRRLLL